MRANSIAEFADRGERVRAWCWRCARGHEWLPWQIRERRPALWDMPLDQAARRFRCRACHLTNAVQLLPSRIEIDRRLFPQTGAGLVWAIWREAKKQRRQRQK